MSDISKPITENALQENLVELSQRNEQTHLQIQTLNEMVVRLRKENAKLRELVRIMHSEMVSCEDNGYVCGGHKFDERVRELGIEIEDA